MNQAVQNLMHVLRCDWGSSSSDLRWRVFPHLMTLWVLFLSGVGLIEAYGDDFVRGYAFAHGYDADYSRALIEKSYIKALTGLGVLSLCFVLKRYHFFISCILFMSVAANVVADYSSTVDFQYSESLFEQYRQRYAIELFGLSILCRLGFLGLLFWTAKETWTYHITSLRVQGTSCCPSDTECTVKNGL